MKYIGYNKALKKIALHSLVWLIVFSLPYLLWSHYGNNKPDPNFKSFLILNSLTDILGGARKKDAEAGRN